MHPAHVIFNDGVLVTDCVHFWIAILCGVCVAPPTRTRTTVGPRRVHRALRSQPPSNRATALGAYVAGHRSGCRIRVQIYFLLNENDFIHCPVARTSRLELFCDSQSRCGIVRVWQE